MNRIIRGVLSTLVLATVVPSAVAQIPMASGFGEANIGGERVFVHVTVAVPPGIERAQAVADGIRGMGARPIDSAEFSLTGLDWSDGSASAGPSMLRQNHSSAMTNGEVAVLGNTHATWTGVDTSIFAFVPGVETSVCPSLARECPGPQYRDDSNDVAFVAIGGCCTLAATWFVTSGDPEADIIINNRVNWGSIDLETVLLHENGHALGLGHSTAPGSIMAATYAGLRTSLSIDDERGITYLYPKSAHGSLSGHVRSGGQPVAGARVTILHLPMGTATTDSTGYYQIADVPIVGVEPYAVTVTADNYRSVSEDVLITEDKSWDVDLTPSNGGGGGDCKKAGPRAC